MKCALLLNFLLAASAVTRAFGEEAPAEKPSGRQVTVVTIADESITAPLTGLRDGALQLDTKPPRSISLLDLQRLSFAATSKLSVQWIGQDGHDVVQAGAKPEGNGISDVHLRLMGLPEKQIKQLRLALRSPARTWRMEPSGPAEWRLAVERTGNSNVADIYFEPPSADLFAHTLRLNLTFADDSSEALSCDGKTHTNKQTKIASGSSAEKPSVDQSTVLDLECGDMLHAQSIQLTEESVSLKTPWNPELKIPLLQVKGMVFSKATADAKARYQKAIDKPGTEDLLIVTAKDGGLTDIAGHLQKFDSAGAHITYEGEDHTIAADRLQAVALAAHPRKLDTSAPCQVVHLSTGDIISGTWQGLGDSNITLAVSWLGAVELPLDSISDIQTRHGNLVQLSDMQPASVEEVAYFGRTMPHRSDQALDGGPLKMKGRTYAKGLAVHSRCVLNYMLDGQYAKFKTLVGFDDSAGDKGRVACRVLADGKEIFAKPDLRAIDAPQELDVSVEDAKQLSLEIDFGEDQDIGDRVIWAEPRLFRK